MDEVRDVAELLLGLGDSTPSWGQTAVRAVVMYFAALVMVRWGEKRFMGKNTAFDVILGVMIGSVISRAITGNAELLPTIAAGLILIGLHWAFASLAFRSDRLGRLMKGSTRVLVKDGEIDWKQMRRGHISHDDLLAALRTRGVRDPADVAEARLERSGQISVVEAAPAPTVLDAHLADGTLTIRIRLE